MKNHIAILIRNRTFKVIHYALLIMIFPIVLLAIIVRWAISDDEDMIENIKSAWEEIR